MATIVNATLLHLGGATAVTAYTIVTYIDMMMIPVLYGLVSSIAPAVGYNFGAKLYDRVYTFFKITTLCAIAISLVSMVVMLAFPSLLVGLFLEDGEVQIISLATTALLLYAPSYLFNWIPIVVGSFFTSLERPKESILIMSLDSVILPLVFYVILTPLWGVVGMFAVPTISVGLTGIYALWLWHTESKWILGAPDSKT